MSYREWVLYDVHLVVHRISHLYRMQVNYVMYIDNRYDMVHVLSRGVLQCVAVCCSVLQCVAGYMTCYTSCLVVCCSMLQCVAVCCSVLQCAAAYCSVLQCVAVFVFAPNSCNRFTFPVVAVCCNALHCVGCCRVLIRGDNLQSFHISS